MFSCCARRLSRSAGEKLTSTFTIAKTVIHSLTFSCTRVFALIHGKSTASTPKTKLALQEEDRRCRSFGRQARRVAGETSSDDATDPLRHNV